MLKRQFCYAGKRQQVVVASKWAPIICLNYCKLGSSQQKQVCLADHADTQRNVLLHYQATCRLQPQVYWPLGSFRVFKKRGDTMSCTWMRCVHAKNEEKLYRLVLLDLVGWTLESLFTLIGRLYLQLSTFLQRFRVYSYFRSRNEHFIWENIPIQKQIKHFGRTFQHNFVTKVVHLIDSRIWMI